MACVTCYAEEIRLVCMCPGVAPSNTGMTRKPNQFRHFDIFGRHKWRRFAFLVIDARFDAAHSALRVVLLPQFGHNPSRDVGRR